MLKSGYRSAELPSLSLVITMYTSLSIAACLHTFSGVPAGKVILLTLPGKVEAC